MALPDGAVQPKIDENADPKIQIQQAIEDAQRQHQALSQQAAQVIGNQRQLEMRLNRQLADIEKLQANVRQALTLADQATAAGDAPRPPTTTTPPRRSPPSWSPPSRASRISRRCTIRRCRPPNRPRRRSNRTP